MNNKFLYLPFSLSLHYVYKNHFKPLTADRKLKNEPKCGLKNLITNIEVYQISYKKQEQL